MDEKEDIFEQLSAYLDGELSDAQKARVEAALRDDPALVRELESLRATRELVRSLPKGKVPEDFTASVMDKAERRQLIAPTAPVRRWRFRWSSLATAAVVLIVVGIAAVITVSLALTPSWTEKLARARGRSPAAAPKKAEVKKAPEGLRDTLAVAAPAEPSAPGEADKPLDVVEGAAGVSASLAASAERPGDQLGPTNIAPYRFKAGESGTIAVTELDLGDKSSTSGPARGVQEIGVMPPIAVAPGPRGDRQPGVVTQVGEPFYHGEARTDQNAPSSQPALAEAAPEAESEWAKAAGSLVVYRHLRVLPEAPSAPEEAGRAESLVLGGSPGDRRAASVAPTSAPSAPPTTKPGEPAFETVLADALGRPVHVVTTLSDVEKTYASSPADFYGVKDGRAAFNGIVRETHDDRVTLVALADLQGTAVADISGQNKVTIPRDAIVSIQRIPPTNQAADKAGELSYASLFFRDAAQPVRVVTSLRGLRRTYASSPAGFFDTKQGKAVFNGFVRDPQSDKLVLVASADLMDTPVPEIPAEKKAAIPPEAILSIQAAAPASQPASQPADAPTSAPNDD